jgi:CRISPR-associated protein Csd1
MFLAKLKEYAEQRIEQPFPPFYAETPVAWIVSIDTDGRALSPHPISRIDDSNQRGKRGQDMVAPEVQRAAGTRPLLLADSGEYTFGRVITTRKRACERHTGYRDLLDRCAIATGEPAILAVKRFYERGGADQLALGDDWDANFKITFEVVLENGARVRPIDLPAVRNFWREVNEFDADALDQCLVCGELKPVCDRLPAKIKGIRGGQSAGTSIISANSNAFESYGLKASRTAPTCRECAEGFTRGLNQLLADERSHIVVGNTTFVFWTREDSGFNLMNFMQQPDPAEVGALLEAVNKGRRATVQDTAAFYAATLSASGGRAVVRDWIDTTVGRAEKNVARWFALQRIANPRDEDPQGRQPQPLSLFQLAVSTVRKPDDLPVTTPRALFRTALSGTSVPLAIAFQAVRRCRAERDVTRPRAALIKLVLQSREPRPLKEAYMVALEVEHPTPAYHCGRLLAVIERVQQAALPNVNATIVDRYYGAASSTPAIVFGTLLRGAQPHLARLKRDRHGTYVNLQRGLEEVMARIGDWPKTLTLKEQALFSLGYYHQRAHHRTEAIARRAASNSNSEQEAPS